MPGITTNVEVDGVPELRRALRELPIRVAKKGLRKAVNAGATPVVKAYRAALPTGQTGLLKKAVKKKVGYGARTNSYFAVVGTDRKVSGTYGPRPVAAGWIVATITAGKRPAVHRPAYIAHILEGGAKPHAINIPFGRTLLVFNHPGIAGRRPLQSAVNATSGQVSQIVREKLASAIYEAARDL